MGTFQDITERKCLEEQFRQAQKLEAVGQLAGGVAHDFNNILAAMIMRLGLLEISAQGDKETGQAVKELINEVQRAAGLIRQLLMFSRRSVMEIKPLDLNEVVKELLRMLGRLIGENIKLLFDGYTGDLPAVEGDAGMLQQVIMNLVVNARDALPHGGRITIGTSIEAFDDGTVSLNRSRQTGCFVCLSVSDTGMGMSRETLGRIFEPFFTTKEAGKGTGLGLATVHGIVAQHKGWVEVESGLGEGTRFRVFLPIVAGTAVEAAVDETPEPPARGCGTILLVEDEAQVRQLVARTLRALGYGVHEAENGQQAMQEWQRHGADVDLLLTDMVMPEGVTGLELAERLMAMKPSLRVIVSSGYSAEIVKAGSSDRAGIHYLPKPYPLRVLAETVRACLDRRS
jgi:nitrogen-specific signal transduction histidine kinase/ActR/RegA family two-component response regulator